MSGVTTSSLSLAWTLRNWVILDYEEANGLTVRPWAPFLSFQSLERRNSLLNAWSWRTSLARGHSFSHWWAAVFDTILFLFWFLSNRMVSGDPYLALTPSAVVLNEEALNLEGQWRSRNAFQCCTRNWGLCLDSRALVQQKIGSQTIGKKLPQDAINVEPEVSRTPKTPASTGHQWYTKSRE